MNIEWEQFVLWNTAFCPWYKRLVYTHPDLLARFCKVNLSNAKTSYPINISKPLQPQNELLYIASPKFPFLFPIRTPCTHSNTLSTTYRSYINLSFNLRSGGPFSFLFWRWREKHAWYINVTHRLPVVHTLLARLTGFRLCASTPNTTQQHATGCANRRNM